MLAKRPCLPAKGGRAQLTVTERCSHDQTFGEEIIMSMQKFLLTSVGVAALMVSAAQAQNGAALTGKVTSTQEPTMEGVLVNARLDGSAITTTVVTNAQGE
jgi:hypothetical protein